MIGALESSRLYWNNIAAPALKADFPALFPRLAAGLCGNGSECFGYDDEKSMDHDWGVDFFLWVTEEDRDTIPSLKRWKEELFRQHPPEFTRHKSRHGAIIDIMTVGEFYYSLIGVSRVPENVLQWRRAPEENYAMAVNGEVFWDGMGEFSDVREGLLSYYPEDLRRKKIAARCMNIAQTGQYNFDRISDRGDWVTVRIILAKFSVEVMGLVYHLNKVYRPYYKWTWRRLKELPILGQEISALLLAIAEKGGLDENSRCVQREWIARICWLLTKELRHQCLSDCEDWFLTGHGEAVQRTISDEKLKSLPPQYE